MHCDSRPQKEIILSFTVYALVLASLYGRHKIVLIFTGNSFFGFSTHSMSETTSSPEIIQPERDEFMRLARVCSESASRFEDRLVDAALEAKCRQALDKGEDSDIESALAQLKKEESSAYDELLSMAEDCAQSLIKPKSTSLLVLIPILAWSRYRIPFGKLPDAMLEGIAKLYQQYFTQANTRIRIGSSLVSSDHLPEGLGPVRKLLTQFAAGSSRKTIGVTEIASLMTQNPPPDFSDSRFLVLSVTAPKLEDLFPAFTQDREEYARNFMEFALGCHRLLEPALVGCVFQVQYPCAFFSAWRQTDASMQVFALKALVDFVCCMGFVPRQLIATTAVFFHPQPNDTDPTNEVRIGISLATQPNRIIAGVVWPIATGEPEDSQQAAGQILSACCIDKIVTLDQTFPMEWCEDCGAPLYAAPNGLVTHIELPEGMEETAATPPTLN